MDLRLGDGLDGRRQTASTAKGAVEPQQRAVRVDHAPKEPQNQPDEARGHLTEYSPLRMTRAADRVGNGLRGGGHGDGQTNSQT